MLFSRDMIWLVNQPTKVSYNNEMCKIHPLLGSVNAGRFTQKMRSEMYFVLLKRR